MGLCEGPDDRTGLYDDAARRHGVSQRAADERRRICQQRRRAEAVRRCTDNDRRRDRVDRPRRAEVVCAACLGDDQGHDHARGCDERERRCQARRIGSGAGQDIRDADGSSRWHRDRSAGEWRPHQQWRLRQRHRQRDSAGSGAGARRAAAGAEAIGARGVRDGRREGPARIGLFRQASGEGRGTDDRGRRISTCRCS